MRKVRKNKEVTLGMLLSRIIILITVLSIFLQSCSSVRVKVQQKDYLIKIKKEWEFISQY